MSISAISSTPAPAPAVSAGHAAPARAADGDYKAPNALTSKVKDSDGDYKLAAAATSAAAKSSGSVQTALSLLKTGG